MTDDPSWLAITAGSGGWVLFAWLCRLVWVKLASGDLLTRREADGKDAENLRLRESNDYLQEKLGESISALGTMNDALSALRTAAKEKKS